MGSKNSKELYGIDPKMLGEMPHKNALHLKRVAIEAQIKSLFKRFEDLPPEKRHYEELCAIEIVLKQKNKDLELVKICQDEIK